MATNFAHQAAAEGLPWWLILLNGVAAAVVGLLFLVSPGATLLVFIQLLGIYWLVTGLLSLVGIFVNRAAWGWNLFTGILGVLAGIIVLQHPVWSAVLVPTTLVILLGIQGIVVGGVAVYLGLKGKTDWGQAVMGGLSVLFGLLLLANPLLGTAVLPIVLGIFGLVGGFTAITASFKTRQSA